jgi:hypothetical protein
MPRKRHEQTQLDLDQAAGYTGQTADPTPDDAWEAASATGTPAASAAGPQARARSRLAVDTKAGRHHRPGVAPRLLRWWLLGLSGGGSVRDGAAVAGAQGA